MSEFSGTYSDLLYYGDRQLSRYWGMHRAGQIGDAHLGADLDFLTASGTSRILN